MNAASFFFQTVMSPTMPFAVWESMPSENSLKEDM